MKTVAKTVVDGLAIVLIAPALLMYRLGCGLLPAPRALAGWSQALSLLPGLTGESLRRAFYRFVLPQFGDDVCLSFGTVISHPTARLGRKVYTGCFCMLGDVTLEDDVMLGSHVSIINGNSQHGIERLDIPLREQPGVWPHITIGRDTWIGDRSIVMANVGKHCVVGAGSVVTKPVPDYAIIAGNPARILRFRNDPPVQQASLQPAVEHTQA